MTSSLYPEYMCAQDSNSITISIPLPLIAHYEISLESGGCGLTRMLPDLEVTMTGGKRLSFSVKAPWLAKSTSILIGVALTSAAQNFDEGAVLLAVIEMLRTDILHFLHEHSGGAFSIQTKNPFAVKVTLNSSEQYPTPPSFTPIPATPCADSPASLLPLRFLFTPAEYARSDALQPSVTHTEANTYLPGSLIAPLIAQSGAVWSHKIFSPYPPPELRHLLEHPCLGRSPAEAAGRCCPVCFDELDPYELETNWSKAEEIRLECCQVAPPPMETYTPLYTELFGAAPKPPAWVEVDLPPHPMLIEGCMFMHVACSGCLIEMTKTGVNESNLNALRCCAPDPFSGKLCNQPFTPTLLDQIIPLIPIPLPHRIAMKRRVKDLLFARSRIQELGAGRTVECQTCVAEIEMKKLPEEQDIHERNLAIALSTAALANHQLAHADESAQLELQAHCRRCDKLVCLQCGVEYHGERCGTYVSQASLEGQRAAEAAAAEKLTRLAPEYSAHFPNGKKDELLTEVIRFLDRAEMTAVERAERKRKQAGFKNAQLRKDIRVVSDDMKKVMAQMEDMKMLAMCRTCPGCKVPVYRQDGCSKMICFCGTKFCFLCCKNLTSMSNPYDHYKVGSCELWSSKSMEGQADAMIRMMATQVVSQKLKKAKGVEEAKARELLGEAPAAFAGALQQKKGDGKEKVPVEAEVVPAGPRQMCLSFRHFPVDASKDDIECTLRPEIEFAIIQDILNLRDQEAHLYVPGGEAWLKKRGEMRKKYLSAALPPPSQRHFVLCMYCPMVERPILRADQGAETETRRTCRQCRHVTCLSCLTCDAFSLGCKCPLKIKHDTSAAGSPSSLLLKDKSALDAVIIQIETQSGAIDWADQAERVFLFINQLVTAPSKISHGAEKVHQAAFIALTSCGVLKNNAAAFASEVKTAYELRRAMNTWPEAGGGAANFGKSFSSMTPLNLMGAMQDILNAALNEAEDRRGQMLKDSLGSDGMQMVGAAGDVGGPPRAENAPP